MKKLIYVADDDLNICNIIKLFLTDAGYDVETFETGELLLEAFKEKASDLVLLDIMMPGKDGLTICKEIREFSTVPIIMLTAKDSELDYVAGISVGSDDYLTKPFKPTVLTMRVKAIFRRIEIERTHKNQESSSKDIINFGDLEFKIGERLLMCKNKEVPLTVTEVNVVLYMLNMGKNAVSREQLLEAIWGFDADVETRVTDETIRRIRKKLLEANSNVKIKTVWGFGYKLVISEG
ncbi:MAG: response regulator transcription factor [Anaerovoracaceae bacterium]